MSDNRKTLDIYEHQKLEKWNRQGILVGICFVLFGLIMGGFNVAFYSMSNEMLGGFVSGMLVGAGLIFLASRRVRETP